MLGSLIPVSLLVVNTLDAILIPGVAGLMCGISLPYLKWRTWLLIGLGFGILSVPITVFIFSVVPGAYDRDTSLAMFFIPWSISVVSRVAPLMAVMYLAFRANDRRTNLQGGEIQ